MAISLYSNLEDFEAQHGIDFSTMPWSPEDKVIYHATDKSLVSSASRLVNEYCETTFSDYPSCDESITWVVNEVVLRMIRRKNAIVQAMGHTSFSDDYMTIDVDESQLQIELSPLERYKLEKFREDDDVIMVVTGE